MEVDVDLARDSIAFSLPFVEDSEGEVGSKTEGGNTNSSSSGINCLARFVVEVRLFITLRPGVMELGNRLGEGEEGPAPADAG
jgi:hypothetical protein